MADEREILAVFKADIEQYKAQVEEMSKVNTKASASTETVTQSTDNFSKKTKTASGSISTLSKGLSGVTGLLALTGRLFGVNTDKIQGLIFASQQFVRVGQDIIKTQKLAAESTAKFSLASAASIPVIGAIVGAIGAAAAILIRYQDQIFGVTEAQKEKTKADDGALISDEKLRTSYNESIKTIRDLGIEYRLVTGQITEYQATLERLQNKNKDAVDQIQKDTKVKVDDIIGFWGQVKLAVAQAIGLGGLETQKIVDDLERVLGDRNALIKKKEEELTQEQKIALAKRFAEENKRIIQRNEATFQLALKEFEALKKLGQSFESPLERETREHEERLKAAGLFGRSLESLTEFEHAALLREEKDFQDKLNIIIQAGLDEQQRLRDAAFELEEQEQKEQDDAFLKNKAEAQKKTLALAKKGNKDALEILKITDPDSAASIEKELNNKRIEAAQQTADLIFKAFQEASDKRQELLDKEITQQEKNIDVQRDLAARGLENTLAFEQKRAADLQRQQQKEAQQAKRVKLLETFLNSLAEFSKVDPNTALQKALLQVALAQAATAVFAEEGGIIGEIGERSNLRRKHKGGGDVLLHAQTGEGILSRREMDNLGRRNFHLLKDAARFPVRDDVFAMPQLAIAGGMQPSNADVVKELRLLRSEFKNQPREKLDINKYGEYIHTVTQDGITTATKGKLKKNRFKS